MSRQGKKLQHIHSSVPGKQPLPSILEVGELAVNNAAGNEFISTKNTDDEVVRFSSDKKVVSIIEKKTVMPYKGEVLEPTEQDLINNKSQILISLNQVATPSTASYEQVNGAKDMHGNDINPSTDGGKTNGAGFAINMDKYAMIGANPSFSSVTVDEIKSDDELFIGANKELEEGVQMPEISMYGSEVKIHANEGGVGITAKEDINISGENDGNFNVNNNMCIGAGNEMKIGATEKVTIGEDCSGGISGIVEIKGGEVIINRNATPNVSSTTIEGAIEELAEKIAEAGDGYITGGHVDSANGLINVSVLEHPEGATIEGLAEYVSNRLGDVTGIAKRAEVSKETIEEKPVIVIRFFDKDDNELNDLEIVLDDYYNKGDIDDMAHTVAAALNDLNTRVIEVSGNVISLTEDVEELKNRKDNFVTDGEVKSTGIIELNMNASDEPAIVSGLAEYVEGMVGRLSGDTYVTSGSVDSETGVIDLVKNDGTSATPISGLSEYVSGQTDGLFKEVEYVSSSETIVFKDKDGDIVGTVDASRFVKDGMVLSVVVDTPTGGTHAGVECLIITWNNDASPEVDPLVTEIPLSKFFDPAVLDDYYTKDEVNTMLGDSFALDLYSGDNFSSITEVILKDELVVAAALNDLNDRVNELDDMKLDKADDSYLESGNVDTGTGIINLSVKNKGNVEVDGLAEYLDGKISAVSGDTNSWVTGGTVQSDGIIDLVVTDGKGTAHVSGLSEFVESKVAGLSGDTFVQTGSVNTNTGVITLVKNNNTEIQVTGLSAYVSGQTDGLFKEVTYVQSSNTYVFKDGNGDNVGSIPAIAKSAEVVKEGNNTLIKFKDENGEEITGLTINANDFVVDGMVDDAWIGVPTSGDNAGKNCLIIRFNTEAEKRDIEIPVSSIFDQSVLNNYYTKDEINHSLGNWFSPITDSTSSVTEVLSVISGDSIVSGSVNGTTLTLTKENGENVQIIGLPTPGSTEYDGVVTGGTVGTNGTIILNRKKGDGTDDMDPAYVTGLSGYIDSIDKHVTGGSVNQQGIIVVEQNGVSPNVELSGLPPYVDSRLVGKYLPLSGGTVSGNTTFTSDLLARGSNGITATKFVKDGGTNTQVLMADGSVKGLDSIIDGNDYVSGGSVDNQGIIHLENTDPTKSGKITGLSDYVNSVTQNFITADQDKYVTGGSVNSTSGVITLNVKNTESGVPITGLEAYINGKLDGNDRVTGGTVNQSDGVINLAYNNASLSGKITGLAQYVAEHSSVGDWVDVSGDTMTGTLKIASKTDGETNALEVNGPVSVSGDITATGAMYSSDKRLKENIESVSAEDIENVKNVDFKTFNFISNKTSQKIGVIAQELQDNGLGKLTATNDAGYLTVDYISLLCLKIAELEKEIKELKSNKA